MRYDSWSRIRVNLRGIWRHPLDSNKRKIFRARRILEQTDRIDLCRISSDDASSSSMMINLRAAWRHPFNSAKRRAYWQAHSGNRVCPITPNNYHPKVSIIIPNYNHAAFLKARIDSVLCQTYSNFDVLILDDCSSDNSRKVIEDYVRAHSNIRAIFNSANSGSVFRQWRKGIENVSGNLIWICESDDYCDRSFLEQLVGYFGDPSVTLAFGRIQFCDRKGDFQAGLDDYREGAEAGVWEEPVIRPAHQWFCRGFGVNNVIANVGGCIFRRQNLSEAVWCQAEDYSVLGDWFLYSEIAAGGQIAYEPSAVSYFRQHGHNTSVSAFVRPAFYEEHERLMLHLRRKWGIPNAVFGRFYKKVSWQYDHFNADGKIPVLEALIDKFKILNQGRVEPHVLIAFLGFQPGGGELFPIQLANALRAQGRTVSMLAHEMTDPNPEMMASLDQGIPIYDARWVQNYGADRFIQEAGISLIHSHMVSLETFFFQGCRIDSMVPYLVTLHGSYEACKISEETLKLILGNVSHFVYTADRNLEPFLAGKIPLERFSKMGNAMPIDYRPFPFTRSDLGIDDDAIVFTLVARGIRTKGWNESIAGFLKLRTTHPSRKMHLLLCGTGEETDRLKILHGSKTCITFLGYQSCVHGLYRISNCAIVPTRFPGESFPLCIIQALQTGTPVIATDIGDIRNMLTPADCGPGGIILGNDDDNERFNQRLAEAMALMLDDNQRQEFAKCAEKLGKGYNLNELASNYWELYMAILKRHGFCAGRLVALDTIASN